MNARAWTLQRRKVPLFSCLYYWDIIDCGKRSGAALRTALPRCGVGLGKWVGIRIWGGIGGAVGTTFQLRQGLHWTKMWWAGRSASLGRGETCYWKGEG